MCTQTTYRNRNCRTTKTGSEKLNNSELERKNWTYGESERVLPKIRLKFNMKPKKSQLEFRHERKLEKE